MGKGAAAATTIAMRNTIMVKPAAAVTTIAIRNTIMENTVMLSLLKKWFQNLENQNMYI